ncbi:MAG: cell wall hydrolase [Eubacteriales bacterium]|jgi:spore germination cell wall hydrolase CwlJ-like protein
MKNYMRKLSAMGLSVVLLTMLFTGTSLAFETSYTSALTLAQVNESYKEIVSTLYSSGYTLQQQVDILQNEQNKLHQFAEQLREENNPDRQWEIEGAGATWWEADGRKLELMELIRQEEAKKANRYYTAVSRMTQAEKDLMAKIIWLEAGNQSDKGQQAVAEVILNRVINSRFPNTVTEVLYQKGQFTSVKALGRAKPDARVYANMQAVLDGKTNILANDVVYFSRGAINNRVYAVIGDHTFCRI